MFEIYLRFYKHYSLKSGPNTAIFLLVGSFYELYDIHDKNGEGQTSFDRATTILGIQKVPKGDGLFSAGFKDSSLHKFAAMLTRENWTVVIVDQVKDEKGSVSSRDVVRILSPGTHIETTGADSFYTAGLWLDAPWNQTPLFAAAAIELTTGAVHTYEGSTTGRGEWSSDSLLHFFQVHQPKELIVWWRGDNIDQPSETFLRRVLGIPTALIHVRQATVLEQGALEKPVIREDLLRRCFKPKSLLPLRTLLGLTELPHTERALASLILFIEDYYPSAIASLRLPTAWTPETSVYLGNHALTQLNMITAREEDSVLGMFTKTYTPMGRRAMRRRLLYPVAQPAVLENLYREIDWCLETSATESILGNLRPIGDLSRLHRRLTVATINAADVTSLNMSYVYSTRILNDAGDGPLSTFREHSDRFNEYREAFSTVFDLEKAMRSQDDTFCLTDAAGPKTAAIEAEIAAARAAIQTIHRELYSWIGVEKDAFRLDEKEASIIVGASKTIIKEVDRAMKAGQIPAALKGIQIHAKKSCSSLEIPGLNALYGKILSLRLSLSSAVKEELPAACDSLLPFADVWDLLETWIAQVDLSFTIARVSADRGFVRPQLIEATAAGLSIEGLRHPLIESQQTRVQYIKHNVDLHAEGWLVYGMNASGKSSLMKAVGIATILAQCGCYVPASSFKFTPFRSLFTRILNTDNLWAGLSSFAVEMTELAEILRRADPWSLVLGDEVCSGTESMSAMSLVGASLEHLSKRKARFIFATHLHGLQDIPVIATLPLKVWHLQVRSDPVTQRLVYDRTLHPGAGSSLYGLEVAKAMAIPFEVLESAHAIRKSLVGVSTEKDAPLSDWNRAVQRLTCEACGSDKVRALEAHHIQERSGAIAGRLADGSNMNDARNLAVLCDKCHDKVHAETIVVGAVQQTSEGPIREVKNVSPGSVKKGRSDLSDEQEAAIKNDLRLYRTQTAARLIFHIEQTHGIKLTTQRLKTLRASL
jgi:DNA mismatch repair protein MutS